MEVLFVWVDNFLQVFYANTFNGVFLFSVIGANNDSFIRDF